MSDIVQELKNFLAQHPEFNAAFDLAVHIALKMNVPQLAEWGITNLNDYLNFYEKLLNWVPVETFDGKNVYYHLCIFYFILDLPPLRSLQTPILPTSTTPYTYLSNWIIQFAKDMGTNMDKPESLTQDSLQTFKNSPAYRIQDYPEPEGGWGSFNQFFARKIYPELRPIDLPDDDTVIVSPADSVFDGSWDIESNGIVYLKYIPWKISQLLEDSAYKEQFGGGTFTHSFLAPTDYHRQHAPVSGEVLEATVIPGLCYLEVAATADEDGKLSLGMRRGLPPSRLGRGTKKTRSSGRAELVEHEVTAPDSPGYQFLQARGLILINNPTLGLVAVLPIGMAQISSVVLSVQKGDIVTKGQEISYFQCGGSDCVMVFQEKAKVQFTATLGQHYHFGNQIAAASPLTTKV